MKNNMPNPDAPNCGCKWLEEAAKDNFIPVVFDELMHEYHLTHSDSHGYSLIYHCPFCGGTAPKSLRGTYWSTVSLEESSRLQKLTLAIKSPEELFSTFGTPDEDFEVSGGSVRPETDDQPSETVMVPRLVIFRSLSETAEVHVHIDRYERLEFSFVGRYIGPIRSEAT